MIHCSRVIIFSDTHYWTANPTFSHLLPLFPFLSLQAPAASLASDDALVERLRRIDVAAGVWLSAFEQVRASSIN